MSEESPEDGAEIEEAWEPATREVAALRDFLERQHLAQQEGRLALYDRPVSERVASGMAVDELVFQGTAREREKDLLIFACRRNQSRFRPGTRLRLSRGDARKPAARVELIDDRYDGKKYLFRLAGGPEKTDIFETAEPWVLDEDVFDLLDLQLDILQKAEKAGLTSWLDGTEPAPAPGAALTPNALSEEGVHGGPAGLDTDAGKSPLEAELEGSIRTAFEQSLACDPYFSVQGPPGSGKTHLLARLALHYALVEKKRVLITAVSHQAIHHALAETYWVGKRVIGAAHGDEDLASAVRDLMLAGFYKIGSSRGNNEGLPDGVQARFRAPARQRPLIAGGTVYSAMLSHSPDRPGYDVVLFDEAGQAPLILALAARVLAPKVVFIGDDAQLPPVIESALEDADPLARTSTLGFIRERYGDPVMLTETRRLNGELCAVISDCFYDGALAPTPEAETRRFALKARPAGDFSEILDPESSLVFVDVPHGDCRGVSEPEAVWAAALAAETLRCGLPPEELGIIAPYRAQCNRIRHLMGEQSPVLCSTVERFQGQEREMVVISLTSSNPRYLSRLAGFLFNPNRLNVAVSRARSKVVILGSLAALKAAAESADPDSEGASGFSVFLKILKAARPVDGSAPPDLDAPSSKAPARRSKKKAEVPEGQVFEPGGTVEHPKYGLGLVIAKSVQLIDNRREWVNNIRFNDGQTRLVIPRLSQPPMRLAEEHA